MPRFEPAQLSAWTNGQWTGESACELTGFGIDTRKLESGQIFVALRTEQRDGHDYLNQAKAAGASAALVAEARPESDLPQLVVADPLKAFQQIALKHRQNFTGKVIGITGSAGKTSTKNLLAGMLGARTLATEGNLNNHLGVPLTLTRLDGAAHDFAVVEAGISGPGEMAVLAAMIEPDEAIVTLVDYAHTEKLGDLDGVAREKAILLAAVKEQGARVMPAKVAVMAPFAVLPSTRIVVTQADLFSGPIESDEVNYLVTNQPDGTLLSVVMGGSTPETYEMGRVSSGMVQNAVLAITLARRLGISVEEVQESLMAWRPPAMRGEVIRTDGRLIYLDCYNANPASMQDALQAFADLTPDENSRLLVLGGMEELGTDSPLKHMELGEQLELRSGDLVVAVGTGAVELRAGALSQGAHDSQIQVHADTTNIRDIVSHWDGPIFIKGSRRYQLETVLAERAAVLH